MQKANFLNVKRVCVRSTLKAQYISNHSLFFNQRNHIKLNTTFFNYELEKEPHNVIYEPFHVASHIKVYNQTRCMILFKKMFIKHLIVTS